MKNITFFYCTTLLLDACLLSAGTSDLSPAYIGLNASISSAYSGKCIDVEGGGTDNTTRILFWTCNNAPNQTFTILPINDQFVQLQFQHSGKCLTVQDLNVSNSSFYQENCDKNNASQQFKLKKMGKIYNIQTRTGLCLDLSGRDKEDGAPLKTYQCEESNPALKFFIQEKNEPKYISSAFSGKCIDAEGGGIDKTTSILFWTCNHSPNQAFTILPLNDQFIQLRFQHSGKCLAVQELHAPNSSFYQADCDKNEASQLFEFIKNGSAYNIKTQAGLCLDLRGLAKEDGAPLRTYECEHWNPALKFFIQPQVEKEDDFILLSYQKEPRSLKAQLLRKNLEKEHWNFEILTKPEWKGPSSKLKAYEEKLAQLPNKDTIVVLMDGDLATQNIDKNSLLNNYKRISQYNNKNRIIVSAEEKCCVQPMGQSSPGSFISTQGQRNEKALYNPAKSTVGNEQWSKAMGTIKAEEGYDNAWNYNYLNSSAIIGRAGDLLEMLKYVQADENEDDQALLTEYFIRFPDRVLLDYNTVLFPENRVRGNRNWLEDLIGKLGIYAHDGDLKQQFRSVVDNKQYVKILNNLRRENSQKVSASKCGEIIGLKPHVDHFIHLDAEARKNIHEPKEKGQVYTIYYRGRNFDGTLDKSIRVGLIGLPKSEHPLPLVIWAHEWFGSLTYGHMSSRLRNIQNTHIVAAPVFPGEKLVQRNKDTFFSQVGSNGDEYYDADVFDVLTLHDCLYELNKAAELPIGTSTDLNPTGFYNQKNPFYGKFIVRDENVQDARWRTFYRKILPAVYAGYSRGALVATMAAAKLGMTLAAEEKIRIGVSALALFAPVGPWINEDKELLKAAVGKDEDPEKIVERKFLRWTWKLKSSPKLLHKQDYQSLIDQYVLKLANRDAAFLAPYVRVALSFGGSDGGALLLLTHERDWASSFPMYNAIWEEVQHWDAHKIKTLTGINPAGTSSFWYVTAALEGPGTAHMDIDGVGGPFISKLKKPIDYEYSNSPTKDEAFEIAKNMLDDLQNQNFAFPVGDDVIPNLSGFTLFRVWLEKMSSRL